MEKTLAELSASELEELVERTIDRRINVWFTQLMDALIGSLEDKSAELQPGFAASLRQSLEQARSGEGTDLTTFREQIGRRMSFKLS